MTHRTISERSTSELLPAPKHTEMQTLKLLQSYNALLEGMKFYIYLTTQ